LSEKGDFTMIEILEPWIHFIHVLSAIIWVGGGVMLSLIGARTRKSEDARLIGEFARTLSYVGLRVLTPAVVAVLLTGLWLVLTGSEWKFTQLWVLLGLSAFIAVFLIGAIYLSRIAIQLDRLTAGTDINLREARDLLGRWILGYQIILVILIFAVWDMVFKPGL
jgi:uncharacterized membrane protein